MLKTASGDKVIKRLLFASSVALAGTYCPLASANGFEYNFSGYLREYMAWKLENSPDFGSGSSGKRVGSAGDLIMARTVVRLDFDGSYGDIRLKAIGRLVDEANTRYLKDLAKSVRATGGNDDFVKDDYEDGHAQLREVYAIFPVTSNLSLTLGKQQVAWGEGDFFRTADIIHGNDLRWSPAERENEETRNPLWLVNAVLSFPTIESQLQLILRPGWDAAEDVVNLRDIFGGRGTQQPFKGFDLTAGNPRNFHHSTGDTNDANYGARWMSRVPGTNLDYTLFYYRGLWRDGVTNSVFNPKNELHTPPPKLFSLIGETIYPTVDQWGTTWNYDIPGLNMVLRGEATYIPNRPFNYGSKGFVTPFFTVPVPGLGGIKEKSVLSTLWAFDKNVNWTMDLLKTQRAGLWTVEIFDDWITNLHNGDDLVAIFGNGATAQEHHTIFTSTLTLNYKYDNIQPGVALLWDLNYGDVVFVPSLALRFGDHWRVYSEATLAVPKHTIKPVAQGLGEIENDSHVLGLDSNNNQLMVRVTYEF